MKKAVCFLMAFLFLALTACSSAVSRDPVETSPISYVTVHTPIERSVGRLRRLAIAPLRYKCTWFILRALNSSTCMSEEVEENVKRALLSASISFLSDWRGYDAAPIDSYENLLQERLEFSPEHIRRQFDILADWAMKSSKGEQPPTAVVTTVSLIGRALNVDGLLLIQLFDDARLDASIFEVSSGRIVWSRKGATALMKPRGFLKARDPKIQAAVLFGPLEHAIPKVLVEEN